MVIAVRRPGYFPPLLDAALLQHVDHFVLADTFRFRRKTFHNRSKLRNPQGGHWISIPLVGLPEGAPLVDVEIDTAGRWREKHWRSFLYDYRTTMYFPSFKERLRSFFETEWTRLAACTCRSVELQAALFGLQCTLSPASGLEGAPRTLSGIVEQVEADTLLVPEGTPPDVPDGLAVRAVRFEPPTYHQNFEGFVPGLSAMDLLLNYGPEARRLLADATTVLEETAA